MSIAEKSFRPSVVGGFNRKDVTDYLEQTAREYESKTQDLVSRLEAAQGELKKSQEALAESAATCSKLQAELDAKSLECEKSAEDLAKIKSRAEDLNHSLASKDENLRLVNIERDALSKRLTELRNSLDELEQSKMRVANIELEAYNRAKKIEEDAQAHSVDANRALAELFQDAKRRYITTKDAATRDILKLSDEMERIRDAISGLPSYFDTITFEVEELALELTE